MKLIEFIEKFFDQSSIKKNNNKTVTCQIQFERGWLFKIQQITGEEYLICLWKYNEIEWISFSWRKS